MKLKHYVSQISSPNPSDNQSQMHLVNEHLTLDQAATSRNLPDIYHQEFQNEQLGNNQSPQRVRFRENTHAKKFTTPTQSNPGSAFQSHQTLAQIQQNIDPLFQRAQDSISAFGQNQAPPQQISSPSTIKVIDLRNPQIRKLVMDSLNDIIAERKKSRTKNNQNYQNILKSTPASLRIQNSIDEEAVLIEKINILEQQQQRMGYSESSRDGGASSVGHQERQQPLGDTESVNGSRPPSRIGQSLSQSVNNGILKMSPRSQSKFFESLNKIYQEQQLDNLNKKGNDFEEEPHSPEYTIVSAIDDSCILFAVKESQGNPNVEVASDCSSLESSRNLQSPLVNRTFNTGENDLDNPEVYQQLAYRLQGIENQENAHFHRNDSRRDPNKGIQYYEQYSIDKKFLMIHPQNLRKLTPTLKAPQISRQPSYKHIDYFDLQNQYHVEILCQRLQELRQSEIRFENLEENESQNNNNNVTQQVVATDNETRIFLSYQQNDDNNNSGRGQTPMQSRVPPSRTENATHIDIDLLVSKLLEIPNEELLDSLLNLSINEQNQLQQPSLTTHQSHSQPPSRSVPNNPQFSSELPSGVNSSGFQTPHSNSFSTPIQAARLVGGAATERISQQQRGLDLRSPQTKFNLMRKLQEVKEQYGGYGNDENVIEENQYEEEENVVGSFGSRDDYHPEVAGSAEPIQPRGGNFHRPEGGIEMRAVNNFSRIFINEEDEDDESNEDCRSFVTDKELQSSQPTSLVSPQRSFNSTMNPLQLRNISSSANAVNQHILQQQNQQPQIDLLIQKLKKLEQKRSLQTQSDQISKQSSRQSMSESESPQKQDQIIFNNNGYGQQNNGNNQSASFILEQVIKRLERLKSSRDSSV